MHWLLRLGLIGVWTSISFVWAGVAVVAGAGLIGGAASLLSFLALVMVAVVIGDWLTDWVWYG